MKNKFFYKIFFNYIVILFLVLSIFMVIVLDFSKKRYINNIEEILKDISFLTNEIIKEYVKDKKNDEIDKFIKKIAKNLSIRITVIKNDGGVIADSDNIPSEMGNQLERVEIQQALKNQTGTSIRYSSTENEKILYFARKFSLDRYAIQYFIRTSFYFKKVNMGFVEIRNKLLLAYFFIFLFFMVLIYFYFIKLNKPIQELKNATTQIAKGNFGHKVFVYEDNEFKDLADNFNSMVDEVKKLFVQLCEKQEQMKTIISSIDEGVLVIEDSGKIVFVNDKFNEIVENRCVESKFYWEFLLPTELIKIVEYVKKNKSNIYENLSIKTKNYICHTSFLIEYNKIIIILYDISKLKELEKLKKDLVANVSHEIKTPLTAIKGFAETVLEETKDKKIKHYLEIINSNTQRLINIVEDLLVLSDLEQEKRKVQIEEIDLYAMIKNIEKIFVKRLKEKALKLETNIKIQKIKSDNYIIEQIFLNLIDNAIKYTDKGEIRINIYRKDEKNIIVEISDTGIGISEEHIPRVFDRFYVTDKSRSKSTGGTGLGLSIVKHAVVLLGGQIAIQSKINEGTKFIIVIPS